MKPNFVKAKLDFINEYLGSDYRNLPEAEAKFFEVLEATGGGGGGGPINTDFLPEGSVNLYYTNARVQAALVGYASLTSPQFVGTPTGPTKPQSDNTNALATTAYVKAAVAAGGGGTGPTNTDQLPEGTSNLYFTTNRAQGALGVTVANLQTQIDGKAPTNHTHPLSALQQSSATNGQVPSWNGTNWVPVDVSAGGGVVISKSVPPGTIVYGYWSAAPADYLAADGTQVSRTTYSVLWEAMGRPNTGNGSTTFTLPDLRGEFVRGLDSGRGVDVSRILGSPQASQNVSHTHTSTMGQAGSHTHTVTLEQSGSHTHVYPDASGSAGDINTQAGSDRPTFNFNFVNRNTEASGLHTHTASVNTTGNHAHSLTIDSAGGTEARPRNIALLACIKYTAAESSSGSVNPVPDDTDDLPEGTNNLYFTNARAQSANASALASKANTSDVNSALATKADQSALASGLAGKANTSHTHALTDLLQSSATMGQVPQWNGSAWIATTPAPVPTNSDGLAEGTTNLYYTTARSALKANLASPIFTGTPAVPTATAGTNTTQIASTAFVTTGLTTKANTSHTHALSDLTQSGATNGQVPQWDGTAWIPTTVSGGGGGGTMIKSIQKLVISIPSAGTRTITITAVVQAKTIINVAGQTFVAVDPGFSTGAFATLPTTTTVRVDGTNGTTMSIEIVEFI